MESQVILITGSSTGFGRGAAEQLARGGHVVYATMRATAGHNRAHADALGALAASEGLALHVLDVDVTDEPSVRRAVARVVAEAGRVDVLVNNAGVWGPGVLEAFTMDQWQQVFDVNVFGGVRAARAVLPTMRRQGAGLVVQISSLQGRFILPYSGPYVASKFAAEAMAETFRYEVAPYGVEVCIVEPYDFMTAMKQKAAGYAAADAAVEAEYGGTPALVRQMYLVPDPRRAGDPAEVVDAIVLLIEAAPGERPVRTTVRNPMPQIDRINDLSREMHAALLPAIGLGSLLALGAPGERAATA
jgi:NAD(P)-dependent dehydrogenase (short-subunit alcohol dehydrogenase family)